MQQEQKREQDERLPRARHLNRGGGIKGLGPALSRLLAQVQLQQYITKCTSNPLSSAQREGPPPNEGPRGRMMMRSGGGGVFKSKREETHQESL